MTHYIAQHEENDSWSVLFGSKYISNCPDEDDAEELINILKEKDVHIAELEAHLEETYREWVYDVCEQCLTTKESTRSVPLGNYTQNICIECIPKESDGE